MTSPRPHLAIRLGILMQNYHQKTPQKQPWGHLIQISFFYGPQNLEGLINGFPGVASLISRFLLPLILIYFFSQLEAWQIVWWRSRIHNHYETFQGIFSFSETIFVFLLEIRGTLLRASEWELALHAARSHLCPFTSLHTVGMGCGCCVLPPSSFIGPEWPLAEISSLILFQLFISFHLLIRFEDFRVKTEWEMHLSVGTWRKTIEFGWQLQWRNWAPVSALGSVEFIILLLLLFHCLFWCLKFSNQVWKDCLRIICS